MCDYYEISQQCYPRRCCLRVTGRVRNILAIIVSVIIPPANYRTVFLSSRIGFPNV